MTQNTAAMEAGGHIKYRIQHTRFADDSVDALHLQPHLTDHIASLRAFVGDSGEHWDWRLDYQLQSQHGDHLQRRGEVDDDQQRRWDLTHILDDSEDHRALQKLDRAYLGYSDDQRVMRLGRQAISWGNGLVYHPLDVFNPFAPTTVDKEYKNGDDMAYGQYLRENGDDLQAVWVFQSESVALKYHGFAGEREYDLLLARHYNDELVGAGFTTPLGEALWRGDISATHVEGDWRWSLVTNLAYSWIWQGHNVSALAEYYYNGIGQTGERYQDSDLSPALVERLQRGELFTLGRNYLALSATIEITPLWLLTPTLLNNLGDQSALLQVTSQHDLSQNLQLLLSISLPMGPTGSEYGGYQTAPRMWRQHELTATAQLAWYF
ncbi:hypothetical protein HBA55_30260 [Pseudomaricurvus alkylphenolicus]|uniref:hypothetical protein n=1 Tax=Pseudomaricurvus alkylphenolicus TaxID=1306991 RepID=UPI00141EC71E|nr:hypothetical protein [Pseudomaricurvus alkylphenolicus]NIB43925.1 hypothetical protein [Pseudomaricurvus alkylphenolicus]